MDIYTIWNNGKFRKGATVTLCKDRQNRIYPGICIGEDGPGRKRTSIKVKIFGKKQQEKWERNNHILNIFSATLEKNFFGEYELTASDDEYKDHDGYILGVFRTNNGYYGTNTHTGDLIDLNSCMFEKFPGKIIKRGKSVKGPTINTGIGKEIIAIIPPSRVFRTSCLRKVFIEFPTSYIYGLESQSYMLDKKRNELLFISCLDATSTK